MNFELDYKNMPAILSRWYSKIEETCSNVSHKYFVAFLFNHLKSSKGQSDG